MKKILGIAVLSSALILNATLTFAEETIAQETTTATVTENTVSSTDNTTANTTTETTTETATETTTTTTTPVSPTPKDSEFASNLSKAYSITVTAQAVADARVTGLGYGEIDKLYGLTTLSGKPVAEIMTMRQTLGWGEIAQSLGVKVSDLKDVSKAGIKNEAKVEKNALAKNQAEKGKSITNTKTSSADKGSSSKSSSGSGSKGGSSGGGGSKGGSGGSGGGKGGGGHR